MKNQCGPSIITTSVLRLPRGEYRIRTDDLLHARQALWPAELIPQPPGVSRPTRGRVYLKNSSVDKKQGRENERATNENERRSRKEVFQPHLPVRLPCYDLAPITSFALGRSLRSRTSGAPGFHGLTGGVYKARERIHRAMADARLLANPASWGRVADPSPN